MSAQHRVERVVLRDELMIASTALSLEVFRRVGRENGVEIEHPGQHVPTFYVGLDVEVIRGRWYDNIETSVGRTLARR